MKLISVLLADDHNVVRQGLRALLSPEANIRIVGEASNGLQAVQLAKELRPDLIVMDLAMPELSGLEASRQILREQPQTKIVVLTSYVQDEYVEEMIEAGVLGYLNKQTAAQELVRAIHEVAGGNAFFSPTIGREHFERSRAVASSARAMNRAHTVTPREAKVLQLIAEGLADGEMATALGIRVKTIEKHRENLMRKLGIQNVADLTRYAASTVMAESREDGNVHGAAR